MAGKSSELLKKNKEKILSLWEERSLKEVASATTIVSLILRDSLPIYLDHLSEALATNRKVDVSSVLARDEKGARIGQLHGRDRAGHTSYLLTELIFEYHILREVIFQVLEEDEQLPRVDRDIILDSIEQAVNDAAVTFSKAHADTQEVFINTLTHDLKNPISGAKMSAELILRRSDRPDAVIALAGRIIGSMNRLNAMIRDLLDAGRIRAGEELSLQFEQCDLNAVIREVVDEMAAQHGDRFVLDSKKPIDGEWGCDGLRRALENLIGNAVKYGAPNAPITVSSRRTETGIELSVHNEGPTIPAEEIPLLFHRYRRSKSAEESTKIGWGLGLTLVKGVMDAHRGKIRIESAEGKGTTFVLELPSPSNDAPGLRSISASEKNAAVSGLDRENDAR